MNISYYRLDKKEVLIKKLKTMPKFNLEKASSFYVFTN